MSWRRCGRWILLGYYVVLVPIWVGLVVAMMSADLDPLRSWLGVPFGLVLLIAGVHLAYFRREHAAISRRFFPYASRPEVTVPLVAAGFVAFGAVLLVAGLRSL
ncbi:MAG: hypothetical protein M3P51_11615 [Chloroflexota bacterium]|nr:hypothetical protein [Chloroflexota bacterium]